MDDKGSYVFLRAPFLTILPVFIENFACHIGMLIYLCIITDSRIISRGQFDNGAPQYLILLFTNLDNMYIFFCKLHSLTTFTSCFHKNEFQIFMVYSWFISANQVFLVEN